MIMYTVRTTDPTNHQLCCQKCDDLSREELTCILGKPLNDAQWQQAQLPAALGGLGLSAAKDHAPAAYTTSLFSSQDLKLRILYSKEEESPVNILSSVLLASVQLDLVTAMLWETMPLAVATKGRGLPGMIALGPPGRTGLCSQAQRLYLLMS
jgi:hypothetical protein